MPFCLLSRNPGPVLSPPFVPWFVVAIAVALAIVLATCTPEPDGPPNVVIVSIDTLRLDSLGFTGAGVAEGYAAETPNIDRLVESGVWFEQAIAPIPRTTPALASMLTGLYPWRHGSREVGDPATAGTLLSERLRDAGYTTLAVSANQSAGPKQNLAVGFEHFVDGVQLKERYAGRLYRDREDVPSTGVGWAEATTDEALELVAEAPTDRPLFLWTFYFDPHFFYRPPSPFQDGVEAQACWQMTERLVRGEITCAEIIDDVYGEATEAMPGCRRLYQAEVNYTDAQIGRLLDGLERVGRRDNTIFVFTADHGENIGEAGLFYEHGENVHDVAIRVPLVFAGPGIARGRRDSASAGLIDVLPTVLELLGLEPKDDLDGESLASRLRVGDVATPGSSASRPMFAESATGFCRNSSRILGSGRLGGRACIHGKRYSYCRNPSARGASSSSDRILVELYDHQEDPLQTNNLAGQLPEVEAHMQEAFERWPPENARQRTLRQPPFKLVQTPLFEGGYATHLFDLGADGEERDIGERQPDLTEKLMTELEEFASLAAPVTRTETDPETTRMLEALGYIQ